MSVFRLALRGLRHYRREHAFLGAATAVAVTVLVGALVVGDSVRGSLLAAFTARLGAVEHAVLASSPFSADPETGLAARLGMDPEFAHRFAAAAPVLRRAGTAFGPDGAPTPVTVYGVDRRFFAFHAGGSGGRRDPEGEGTGAGAAFGDEIGRGAVRLSRGLREEWGERAPRPGEPLLLSVESDAAIAAASLFGDKEEVAAALRRTVEAWPAPAPGPGEGDFEIFPRPGPVRAVFLPLDELARVGNGDRRTGGGGANTLLLRRRSPGDSPTGPDEPPDSAVFASALAASAELRDFGLSLREAGDGSGGRVLESRGLVLGEPAVEAASRAAEALGVVADPVLTWLAETLSSEGRETPYSLVSGLPERLLPEGPGSFVPGAWLAEDLGLTPGRPVEVEFLAWESAGRYGSRREAFLSGAPLDPDGLAGDPTLSPEYPGVTDSASMGDWAPPFPVALSRIREKDEDYWERRRTLPKAFLSIETARRLAGVEPGAATSVRFTAAPGSGAAPPAEDALAAALVAALDPGAFGLGLVPVREQGTEASRGATDFGLYFLYFSFFLLASSLVLIALLFRLGVERRLPQIGLLLACGWPRKRVTSLLLAEAGTVAFLGALVGAAVGLAYAAGMIELLTGAWGGAVAGAFAVSGGGSAAPPLELFASWRSVAAGAFGGLEMAALSSWWTARRLLGRAPRALLAGDLSEEPATGVWLPAPRASPEGDGGPSEREPVPGRSRPTAALASAAAALVLVVLTGFGTIPEAAGFFGAGALLLGAALLAARTMLRARSAAAGSPAPSNRPFASVRGLAFRASSFRPGRSLAAVAMIAFAAFLLVAVESFREGGDPGSLPAGAGGFLALTETALGTPWDPTGPEGREALNLPEDLGGFRLTPLRLAGEEDASCLNLYRPDRPRVVGAPRRFAEENRFPFAAHLGETPEEEENPWRLLRRERAAGDPIPVVGDQNSMTYVLKWPIGETRSLALGPGGEPVRLQLVATLWDSIFQGELLMAEEDLLRSLPADDGYRMFLVDEAGGAESAGGAGPADGRPDREEAAAALLADALGDYGAVSTTARARLAAFHRVENAYLSTFQALGGLGLLLGTIGLGAALFRSAAERRREWALLAAAGYRKRDFWELGFWENALLLGGGLAAGAAAALVAVFPVLGERGGGGSAWLLALLLLGVLALGLLAGGLAARLSAGHPLIPALRSE